ncbi:MAG: PorP/SprF family type IX secretion system membrane protein [Saprospiraceae bacterium]|nr:PorP/SprF family type IX secretion system membrane protein [Saprospiraceae bacterium]
MKKIVLNIGILLLLFQTIIVNGQDANFSIFGNNPLYYNPATPGVADGMQFRLNYRNVWPGIPGDFETFKFSSDMELTNLNTGIGILAMSNWEGESFLRTNQFGFCVAPTVNILQNTSFSVGIMSSYVQKSIDWSKLEFDDQLDKLYGNIKQTNFSFPSSNSKSFADVSTGMLFRHKVKNRNTGKYSMFNIGFAAHHVTEPDQSLIGANSPLKAKFVIHSNYLIVDKRRANVAYSPGFIYEHQSELETFTLGMNFFREPIYSGIWFRNRNYTMNRQDFESFIFTFGYIHDQPQGMKWKFGYSYDATVSKLSGSSFGSHEIFYAIYFKYGLRLGKISDMMFHKRRTEKKIKECPPGFEY